MDFLGKEGKAAAGAITNLCDKAAACIDVPEVRGLILTVNSTAANAKEISSRVRTWTEKIDGLLK